MKYDSKTLKAIKGSIKKWEMIVAGKGVDDGMNNCPLCQSFFHMRNCEGCPVAIKTKTFYCDKTPYEKWDDHHRDKHFSGAKDIQCPTCKKYAEAEVKFLKLLLPKED